MVKYIRSISNWPLVQLQTRLWETGSCDNSCMPLDVVCVHVCVCSVAEGTTQRILYTVLWICWEELPCFKQIKCIIYFVDQQTENDFLINKDGALFYDIKKTILIKMLWLLDGLVNWDSYLWTSGAQENDWLHFSVIGTKVLLSVRQCGVIYSRLSLNIVSGLTQQV